MVIEEHARLELFLPGEQDPIIIPEEHIIQNSLSVTSQCVNGNVFAFGCVSPAQLSVKFRIPESENLNRYEIYGAKIRLYSCFGDHQPESGDLRGVFNVTTASKKNGIFTISALDNVCLLDNAAFFEEDNNSMGNAVCAILGGGILNAVDVFANMGQIVNRYAEEELAYYVIPLESYHIPNGQVGFSDYDYQPVRRSLEAISTSVESTSSGFSVPKR